MVPVLTAGMAFSSSFVKPCHGPPELLVPLPAVGSVQLIDVEPSVSSEQRNSPDLTGTCKSSIAQVEAVPSSADSNTDSSVLEQGGKVISSLAAVTSEISIPLSYINT